MLVASRIGCLWAFAFKRSIHATPHTVAIRLFTMELLSTENIYELMSSVDNILFDCDGVIWGGNSCKAVLENADVAVNKLVDLGKNVFFVTNNSVRSRDQFFEKIKSTGIKAKKQSAICSPYIVAKYLRSKDFKKKVYIIGSEGLVDELQKWGFDCIGLEKEVLKTKNMYSAVANNELNLDPHVGAVVVGLDVDFSYEKIIKACCYLTDPDCLFISSNIDMKYPVLNTNYYLAGGGVMTSAIEAASGRKATIVGKPSPLMFEVLSSKYNLDPERTLMVGDTLHTDVVFGNTCGMKTLLVLTGVNSKEDVRNISSNREMCDAEAVFIPQYYIPSLGNIAKLI